MNIQFLKTAKFLFIALVLSIFADAQKVNIIPYPNHVEAQTGNFNFSASAKIYYDKDYKNEAMFLQQIPTVKKMNYLLYPRIAAPAEVGWTSKEQMNFEPFKNALNSYLISYWKKKEIIILPEQLDTPAK